MNAILDIDIYNSRMRAAIYDKLWFIDHPVLDNVKQVYDYGCADGSLLECVHFFKPEWELYGYDVSEEMLDKANEKFPFAHYISVPMVQVKDNTLLVASSVFHEIHNYSEDIEGDYHNIFECGAKYIAIRDMFFTEDIPKFADLRSVNLIRQNANADKVLSKMLDEFENMYGSITESRNFVHFLLKYRYRENWARELPENYFPYTFEEFYENIRKYNYSVVDCQKYTLPYLKSKVYEDFSINLTYHTHAKILLEKMD